MAKTPKTKQNENFAVRVTLTPEQARAVITAIDFYMRVRMGQFSEIGSIFWDRDGRDDRVTERLNQIKGVIYPNLPGPGAAHSISGVPYKDAKVGYDILQVIRHAMSWHEAPQGGITVNFDSPLFVSDSNPRPKAEILGPLELLAAAGFEVGEPDKKGRRRLKKR